MIPAPGNDAAESGQRGLSTLELVMAASVGLSLMAVSGYLFLRQASAYAQVKKVADSQAIIKKCLHVMTRDIASAGGWIGNPRRDFSAAADRIRFAYFDVHGRYCGTPDTVVMSFFLERDRSMTAITQEFRCGPGRPQRRRLASGAAEGLGLAFRYLDSAGTTTGVPGRMKAVRIALESRLEPERRQAGIDRSQSVQVEMVNF